jgi:hypothetical protein
LQLEGSGAEFAKSHYVASQGATRFWSFTLVAARRLHA